MGGVDQRGGQVQQTGGTQFGEQAFVQLLPDAGLVPFGQPPPAGGARGPEERGRRDRPARHGRGPAAATHLQVSETRRRSGWNPGPSQVVTDLALISSGE